MSKISACGLIRRRFCKGNLIDEEFRYTYNIFVRSFCQKPFDEIERNIELAEKCQKLGNEKGATPHRSLPRKPRAASVLFSEIPLQQSFKGLAMTGFAIDGSFYRA